MAAEFEFVVGGDHSDKMNPFGGAVIPGISPGAAAVLVMRSPAPMSHSDKHIWLCALGVRLHLRCVYRFNWTKSHAHTHTINGCASMEYGRRTASVREGCGWRGARVCIARVLASYVTKEKYLSSTRHPCPAFGAVFTLSPHPPYIVYTHSDAIQRAAEPTEMDLRIAVCATI